jgi:signal transduction histidine kinase
VNRAGGIERKSLQAASLASRIAVGVGAIVVAVLVRIPLDALLQGRNTFILMEPAIAVAAWYGGFVSGGTATGSAIVASVLFYLDPVGSFGIKSDGDFLSLALFAGNGMVLTYLSSGLRGSLARANQALTAAEESASRNAGLQRIALALNRPMAPPVLAQTAIDQAVELLGASGGIVATGTAGDRELVTRATNGYSGGVQSGAGVPNEPATPLGDVIRSGTPLLLRGRADRVAHYPAFADMFTSDGDSIVLPLLYEGVATGAIYLNFDGRTNYGPQDADYLSSIGTQCGSALARSRLIEQAGNTAAKERARAAELQTVLEAMGDGVLVGDSEGRITLSNTAAARLLGHPPARLADLPGKLAEPPEDGENGEDARRFLVRSPVRPRGWLEITHFPVADDSASSDVVILRDVTGAVDADLQRDAFLGVLSHELRTPITTIMVGVDLLRSTDGVRRSARIRGLVADIDADATRLNRIVADLLVLSRSERGALDASGEPVLVHRVVRDVVEREQEAWPDAEIVLTVPDELAPAEAEPTYVEQIIRNLLSNALKYGRSPGKPIEVIVIEADDVVEVRVVDRGVGFAPGETDRLFTLFYRNPKAVAAAPGAGIGLYVCRLLAEAMHGTVWARPRPGGGAEFGFSLPLMRGSAGDVSVRVPANGGATAL